MAEKVWQQLSKAWWQGQKAKSWIITLLSTHEPMRERGRWGGGETDTSRVRLWILKAKPQRHTCSRKVLLPKVSITSQNSTTAWDQVFRPMGTFLIHLCMWTVDYLKYERYIHALELYSVTKQSTFDVGSKFLKAGEHCMEGEKQCENWSCHMWFQFDYVWNKREYRNRKK